MLNWTKEIKLEHVWLAQQGSSPASRPCGSVTDLSSIWAGRDSPTRLCWAGSTCQMTGLSSTCVSVLASTTLSYQGLLKTRAHGILSLLCPIFPVVIKLTNHIFLIHTFPFQKSHPSKVGLCAYFFPPTKHLQPSRPTKTQGMESVTDKTRPKTSDNE